MLWMYQRSNFGKTFFDVNLVVLVKNVGKSWPFFGGSGRGILWEVKRITYLLKKSLILRKSEEDRGGDDSNICHY